MMTTGQEYQEKGVEFFQQRDRRKVEPQLVRRLQQLGYQLIKPSPPVA
jgi:hypothetical protein